MFALLNNPKKLIYFLVIILISIGAINVLSASYLEAVMLILSGILPMALSGLLLCTISVRRITGSFCGVIYCSWLMWGC